jgi:hypothetical protein
MVCLETLQGLEEEGGKIQRQGIEGKGAGKWGRQGQLMILSLPAKGSELPLLVNGCYSWELHSSDRQLEKNFI